MIWGPSHLARPHIRCIERKLFCSIYVSSTDETTRVYFAKEIRNWNWYRLGQLAQKIFHLDDFPRVFFLVDPHTMPAGEHSGAIGAAF